MTNQPFTVPGQRVRWAVAELRKAGIDANVQRGPGGQYFITVEDDDHDWAAGTLAPMMAPPTMRSGASGGSGIKDWIAPGLSVLAAAYCALSGLWLLAGVFVGAGAIMRLIFWLQDVAHARAVRSRNPWEARLLFVAGLVFVALFFGAVYAVGMGAIK